ncbi:MAG: hypothetical protein JXQ27_18065 [Acidobacteria bacterium]|nr:hypothetical protein [Acidobacteriota bacterium]
MNNRCVSRTVIIGLTWLVLAGVGAAAEPLPERWVVETIYPVLAVDHESTIQVRWLFEKMGIEHLDGRDWWQIRVQDLDERTPDQAEFLLDPAGGQIMTVRVREFRQGRWREYVSLQDEPRQWFLQPLGVMPLQFAWPGLEPGRKSRESNFIERVELGHGQRIRTEYHFQARRMPADKRAESAGPEARGDVMRLVITDPRSPNRSWHMTWRQDMPWWSECVTGAYSARVISINGEPVDE